MSLASLRWPARYLHVQMPITATRSHMQGGQYPMAAAMLIKQYIEYTRAENLDPSVLNTTSPQWRLSWDRISPAGCWPGALHGSRCGLHSAALLWWKGKVSRYRVPCSLHVKQTSTNHGTLRQHLFYVIGKHDKRYMKGSMA